MYTYSSNNPVNLIDPNGDLSSWVISGLIGMITSTVCGYISGDRGTDLLFDGIEGFVMGAIECNLVCLIYDVVSAINDGISFSSETGSILGGLFVGLFSFGLSQFTGANIRTLDGVFMDDFGELFFDGFFGFMANVFAAQGIKELTEYSTPEPTEIKISSNPRETSVNVGPKPTLPRGGMGGSLCTPISFAYHRSNALI